MQNFIKIGQTYLEITIFSLSRWPLSAVLHFQIFIFLVTDQVRMAILHCHANFIKFSGMVAEMSFSIFQNGDNCHLDFFKFKFLNSCRVAKGYYASLCKKIVKVGQTVVVIS